MRFSKLCKIHKCAAKVGETRYALSNAQLEIDDDGAARLVTTNGRILAVIPVEDVEGDTAGPVPAAALAEATKGWKSKAPDANVQANGCVRYPVKGGTMEVERPKPEDVGDFPKWKAVIPNTPVECRIALNPEYLLALAQSIGADSSIVIEFREDGGALVVRPGHGINDTNPADDYNERFGVIMPISTNLAVPAGVPLTAGQKAARTRKYNAQAKRDQEAENARRAANAKKAGKKGKKS